MSRQDEAAAQRTPFTLYVDEFHHFVTPSVASILTGMRKYGLGLCLAHHQMGQIKSRSEEVAGAILANAYTRIVFQVGDTDAKQLADGFVGFTGTDLQRLPVGEAIARIGRADCDFNLRTRQQEAVPQDVAASRRAAVVERSQAAFATPRAVIESRFARSASTGRDPKESRDDEPTTPVQKADPGRGGVEHKYLQDLIRRIGEARGFSVTIEKRVLDGHGHIDVALEREALSIGCEISLSTRAAHETGNLAKVVAAGFDYAVLITSKERVRKATRTMMGDATSPRIRFLTAEGFVAFLDEVAPKPKARKARSNDQSDAKTTKPTGLISAERVAEYLGLRPQTLAKMRVQGTSPAYHKVGSRVLYDVAELDAWLDRRKRQSTSDRADKE